MNTSAHTTPKLLILTDDLSGVADCTVADVQAGLRSAIMLRANAGHSVGYPTNAGVLTLGTDMRHISTVNAAATQVAVWHALARPATRLCKKIDSTLRGSVAAEVAALTPPAGLTIVVPAFPATGRTTRDSRRRLHGVAVEDTEVWCNESIGDRTGLRVMLERQDLQTAMPTLDNIRAGAAALAGRLAALQADGVQAMVYDAQTDNDLAYIVETSVRLVHVFWVGSASLAPALIRTTRLGNASAAVEGDAAAAIAGPVLTMMGNMSNVSHAQASELRAAASARLLSLELPVETLDTPQVDITQTVINVLCEDYDVPITPSQTTRGNNADGLHFCRRLATLLAPTLPHVGGLIATGDETARAVLSTAGIDALRLCDEIESGMPLLHAQLTGVGRVLPVVTKAGGFGTPDSLHAAWRRLIETAASIPPKGTHAMTYHPVIGITMGDATGVGPEIVMKALTHRSVCEQCRPLVIGDTARLRDATQRTSAALGVHSIERPANATFRYGIVDCINLSPIPAGLPYDKFSPIAGDATYQYIARAVELTSAGELDAICTAPLNKEALHAGDHIFPDHTEMLAHLIGIGEVPTMFVAPSLRVIHVTTHTGLLDAIRCIEPGLVQYTIKRVHVMLVRAGIENPRIGVCGISPYAGENGLFGRGEEEQKIIPAMQKLQTRGWRVEDPLPADTLFFHAGHGDFDVVVIMYHDRGHGPIKMMGLETGMSVTVGLPVIRTSVDRGTAFDIAGKSVADEHNMLKAFRQAYEFATRHDDPQTVRAV